MSRNVPSEDAPTPPQGAEESRRPTMPDMKLVPSNAATDTDVATVDFECCQPGRINLSLALKALPSLIARIRFEQSRAADLEARVKELKAERERALAESRHFLDRIGDLEAKLSEATAERDGLRERVLGLTECAAGRCRKCADHDTGECDEPATDAERREWRKGE
jgi:hypothetical protein